MQVTFLKGVVWGGGVFPPVPPFPVSQNLCVALGRAVLTPCPFCLQQQTEWQRYLRQSLEVVAKVMELLPTHAFSTLVSPSPAPKCHVGTSTNCWRFFFMGASVPKKSGEICGWMQKLARRDQKSERKSCFFGFSAFLGVF